jgi:hypothetical protein
VDALTLNLKAQSAGGGQLEVRFGGRLCTQLLADELPGFALDFEHCKRLIELFFIAAAVGGDKRAKEIRIDCGNSANELAIDLWFYCGKDLRDDFLAAEDSGCGFGVPLRAPAFLGLKCKSNGALDEQELKLLRRGGGDFSDEVFFSCVRGHGHPIVECSW